jgi:hypothetical protein
MISFTTQTLYARAKIPHTYWIGGWVDPRDGLNAVEKIAFFTLLEL